MQLSRRRALAALCSLVSLWGLPALRRADPRAPRTEVEAFLDAVRDGDLAAVRRLLALEPGLAAAVDGRGRSALVLAFVHGHEELGRHLAEVAGVRDLVEAVLVEDWERLEELARADPGALNAAHPIGGNPLYAGALIGSQGLYRLRALGCSADEAPAGGTGYSAARGALESPHAAWARIGLTDVCGNGGDVNAPQAGGSSVLHGAVLRRDETLVRLAVRKGADVEAVDATGRTSRALAAAIGWKEGEALLAAHASLPRDNRSSRFLLDANRRPVQRPDLSDVAQELQSRVTGSSHAELALLRELVEPDPRLIFSISTDDELAIEACAHTGNHEILRYHLDHGAPLSLPTAVSLGDTETVRFWLDRDPSLIHERGAHDFPLLWYAAIGGGSAPMAELLTSYGTPVEQESVGTTTLHWAAIRGDHDLARFLLDHGAHPEALGHKWSRSGETPLALAADDSKMIALLREFGAKR